LLGEVKAESIFNKRLCWLNDHAFDAKDGEGEKKRELNHNTEKERKVIKSNDGSFKKKKA